jgi:hypothetical protein
VAILCAYKHSIYKRIGGGGYLSSKSENEDGDPKAAAAGDGHLQGMEVGRRKPVPAAAPLRCIAFRCSRICWVEEEGARRKNRRESVGEEGAQGREERIWARLIPERRPRRYSPRCWRLFFLERGARAHLSVKSSVEGFFAKRSLETAVDIAVETGCTCP